MHARILSLTHCPLPKQAHEHGESVSASLINMTQALGLTGLGCRRVTVKPGCHAWPFHSHHNNDELFIVLKGQGTVRLGERRYPIVEGEIIAAPAGGAESAHQIINDSDQVLIYLCISSMNVPDVMEYPDSGKFGVVAGSAPGGDKGDRTFEFYGATDSALDYWHGE
ncbi:cupin domain-containing protein [Halomonas sp. V046]|uniref:cupin domain-containing protein n=1 Tax=Halomonas sp. V046 TaxID=3459611 RepID=UPI004044134C